MAKAPTVEDSLAALAAARRSVATHRLPILKAMSSQLATTDLESLAAQAGRVAELMDAGAAKTLFANYAKALPGLPRQVEAAIKAAEVEAEA